MIRLFALVAWLLLWHLFLWYQELFDPSLFRFYCCMSACQLAHPGFRQVVVMWVLFLWVSVMVLVPLQRICWGSVWCKPELFFIYEGG